MIFRNIKKEGVWVMVDYQSTWKYGYDFMLDAAQTIIDTDFREKLERVAIAEIAGAPENEKLEEVKNSGNILRNCPAVRQESGALNVAGISSIMECPLQVAFFNQTNVVRLFCPIKQLFEEHGDHVFDNYVNSIEIKAYCKDTERRVIQKYEESN